MPAAWRISARFLMRSSDAFAVVREAARVLGMRHFDVQLIGGMVLHEGQIAEMKTGEGKPWWLPCPATSTPSRPRRARGDGE